MIKFIIKAQVFPQAPEPLFVHWKGERNVVFPVIKYGLSFYANFPI